MRKYNQKLVEVAKPEREGYVFLGWKYEDEDELGNIVAKHWDFAKDRVKGDLELTADWFKAVSYTHLTLPTTSRV